jgi:hypothetical protein
MKDSVRSRAAEAAGAWQPVIGGQSVHSKVESHVADIKNQNDYGKQYAEKRGGAEFGPLQRYVSEINSMPAIRLAKATPAKT